MAARLPYVTRNDLPEQDHQHWDQFIELFHKKRAGNPPQLYNMIANAPQLMQYFVALADDLRHGTQLDPKLRELALMTVGRLTGAEYEFVHHWNLSLGVGVKREQLEQLADFERSQAFNDQERAVMRYAAETTQNVKVSDATFNALRGFLDNRRIMELVMNVAFYNMVARLIVPCGVELEAGAKKK
jgi:alkylhydroperoxidase family enzyme